MDTNYFRDKVKERYPDIVIDDIKPICDNGILKRVEVSGHLLVGIESVSLAFKFTPNLNF